MNIFRVARLRARCCSTGSRSTLLGRDVVELRDFLRNDVKTILWTALDLKSKFMGQNEGHLLKGRHVTLLSTLPEPLTQSAATRACSSLGGSLTTVVDKSLNDIDQCSAEDLGRSLSATSDVILVYSEDHNFICNVADGANKPTVAWRSEKYAIIQALADIMTIYEHFKILSPLTLSWVGPSKALFNSYLYLMPLMKINLRFCCNDSNSSCRTSPAMMNVGIQNAIINRTEFHECQNPSEAVYRTDIIVTTGHDIPSLSLRKKDLDAASLEYILLHELPRGKSEISEEVFRSKHSEIWNSRENLTWIAMAVITNLLQDYKPSVLQPKWEIE